MFDFKKYRFGFDIWGLSVFAIIMIPNLIWFAVPAGNDVLRNESITPSIDFIASIFQVIMVASLCVIINKAYQKPERRKWTISIIVAVVIYYLGWCMYYSQIVNAFVITILCIAPCVAFIVYSIMKKNGVALVAAIIFMVCHVIYGCANFIC